MPFADLLNKLKAAASTATTSVIPQAKQGYDMMADMVDRPSVSDADHPIRAMARGGLAGMLNGVGNVADSATSPAGLASMAVGAGGGPMSKLLSMLRPAASAEGSMAPAISAAARSAAPAAEVAGSAAPMDEQLFLENMRRQNLSNRLSPVRFGQVPPSRDEMVDLLARGAAARGR